MNKLLIAVALTSATVSGLPSAHAQPMMAVGKPLGSPDLDPGVISVRLIAGKPSAAVIGADVTLVVNGTPRVARTDAGGRATFKDVPVGATVTAKALDDEKKEIVTEQFNVPSSGGTRLMLTTRPFAGAGGGGENGGGAMPEPRKISGTPRLEQTYTQGAIQVIATYNDLKAGLAPGVPISLVGYKSDDSMSLVVKTTDNDGRVEFANLDRTGNTEYFVLGQLPRGDKFDRLYATPMQLDANGVHVILSGEKKDSTEPPSDDLTKVTSQTIPTDPGKLRVVVSGIPEYPAVVKVFDLATKQLVGEGSLAEIKTDANAVTFQDALVPRNDVPPGMVGIIVHGGKVGSDAPFDKQPVEIIEAEAADPLTAPAIASGATEANGQAIVEKLPTDKKLRVRVKVNGQLHASEAFDLAASGTVVEIHATWGEKGRIETIIDIPHVAGRVMYAESVNRKHLYRSLPFQTMPTQGTQISMVFYPRTLFTFSMGGQVEDQLLGIRGVFTVTNYSWIPYRAPNGDGLILPLPAHFKGAFIDEGDKDEAAVETGIGFRIIRPIPPVGRKFTGGFSLPIGKGVLDWNMDLPIGTYNSSVKILKTDGMFITAPGNAPIQEGEVDQGQIYQVAPITIQPNQAMQLRIVGLPILPAWRIWVPRVLGLAVIAILGGGLAFALLRRRGFANDDAVMRNARREQLLEDLVLIDRRAAKDGQLDDKTKMRRETLISQLEELWGDDV